MTTINYLNSQYSHKNSFNKDLSSPKTLSSAKNTSKLSFKSNEENNNIKPLSAAKSFTKGFFSPITNIFESKKTFTTALGVISASSLLFIATNGAIAPLFVATGAAMTAATAFNGLQKLVTAKKSDDYNKAFYSFGETASNLGLTMLGAKSSLKEANIKTENFNSIKAVAKNIKKAPSSFVNTVQDLISGVGARRLKNFFSFRKPVVVFLDNFKENNVHIKCGFKPDMPHGEVEARMIFAKTPYAKIKRIHAWDANSHQKLANSLENLIKYAKKNPVDHVNLSLSSNKAMQPVREFTGIPLTQVNLKENTPKIIKAIETITDPVKLKKFFASSQADVPNIERNRQNTLKIIRSLEKLSDMGVDVNIVAGNGEPHTVNLYALARGKNIHVVSGTTSTENLQMSNVANTSLVTDRHPSVHYIYKTKGGYAFSEKGKPVIKIDEVSKGPSYFELFLGKKPQAILANEQQHQAFVNFHKTGKPYTEAGELDTKLYSIDKLKKIIGKNHENNSVLKNISNNKWKKAYTPLSGKPIFDEDITGVIKASSCEENYPVNASGYIMGTSFAAPARIASIIKNEFIPANLSLPRYAKTAFPVLTTKKNQNS